MRCSPGRSRQTYRVGGGYDARRFAEGRDLVLCGVVIDHEHGLAGHSDADVAVHALMDALLGAAGLGDIGELFPDTDPAFEGASSMLLLERVVAWLSQSGWSVENVDVTIVCEHAAVGLPPRDARAPRHRSRRRQRRQ